MRSPGNLGELHPDMGFKAGSSGAHSRVEATLKAKAAAPAQPGKAEPPAPGVKARCVIKPAEIVKKSYLETPEDVETFIKDLRQRLEAAIANNQRIQIR